jgi:deazaflavin-dependent oxidoreductase (nitroreductase family)
MAKPYRVTAFVRFNNAVIAALVRRGMPMASFALLTVRGRKSGRPIATPITLFAYEGQPYLIAAYGIVNWVRNLRAAGGAATLTSGRRTRQIHASELTPQAAARILQASVRSGPPGIPRPIFHVYRRFFVLPYLNVTPDASLEAFEREARTHPVFLVQSAT